MVWFGNAKSGTEIGNCNGKLNETICGSEKQYVELTEANTVLAILTKGIENKVVCSGIVRDWNSVDLLLLELQWNSFMDFAHPYLSIHLKAAVENQMGQ